MTQPRLQSAALPQKPPWCCYLSWKYDRSVGIMRNWLMFSWRAISSCYLDNSHSTRSWGLCDAVGNQASLCKRNQTNTCEVTCSLVSAFPFLSQANGSMLKLLNHCTREIHPASFNEVIRWSPDHLRPEWLRGSPSHLQTSSRNPPIRAPHSKPHGQCPMLRCRSLNSEERSTWLDMYLYIHSMRGIVFYVVHKYVFISLSLSKYVQYDAYTSYFMHVSLYHHTIFNIRLTTMVSIQFWYPPASCVQIEIWDSDAAVLQLRLAQLVPDLIFSSCRLSDVDYQMQRAIKSQVPLQTVGVSKNRGTPKWMVDNGKPY